jgi:hypothetical protein
MIQRNYIRYFRVFTHHTKVTEISTNDFCRPKLRAVGKHWLIGDTEEILCAIADAAYSLPADNALFYGYATKVKAMEMAKAGALRYIDSLIAEGMPGKARLLEYRRDHYQDLNITLVEANIHQPENDDQPALYKPRS